MTKDTENLEILVSEESNTWDPTNEDLYQLALAMLVDQRGAIHFTRAMVRDFMIKHPFVGLHVKAKNGDLTITLISQDAHRV